MNRTQKNRWKVIIWICILLSACSKQAENTSKKIAKVGDKILYFSEIRPLMPTKLSKEDSLSFVEQYSDHWIRKQIFYLKAEKDAKIDEQAIKSRLEEYRYALIAHEFGNQYVAQKFSDKITEAEIKTFYEKNAKEFELRQNIVKATFIKIDAASPDKEFLRKLMASQEAKDRQELQQYCSSKAVSYHLQDTTWMDFDELTRQTPLEDIPNKINFLKNNPYNETKSGEFSYLLYVKQYSISEQISPLEFVRDRIKSMILNERKSLLIKELEENLYKEALKNKDFQIFK